MESVSSCSPAAASTSSTPASGAPKSKLPSHRALPPKTVAETGFPLQNARGSLAPESMPHSRDERRDDTAMIQQNADKARWLQQAPPPAIGSRYHDRSPFSNSYFYPGSGKAPAPWLHQQPHSHWSTRGESQVVARDPSFARRFSNGTSRSPNEFHRIPLPTQHAGRFFTQAAFPVYESNARFENDQQRPVSRHARDTHSTGDVSYYRSTVVIPQNISIPKDLSASSEENVSPTEESLGKRSSASSNRSETPPAMKRSKNNRSRGGFDKLDLLCSATLELGPLQENPSGCSCPKSKCIALYCDCFKAGRRCDASTCSCMNCKNTIEESGASGARSKAIQAILARNPRAFTNAGNAAPNKLQSGEQACNCIRSRCLKLYCTCFQQRKPCSPGVCTCVGCLNEEGTVERARAIEMTLDKRPDAFKQKSKDKVLGAGCACKNNQCIRKYCECFRTELKCTNKCSCKECKNQEKS